MELTTLDAIQDDIVQLVGFHVGQRLFGADIMTVREILRDPKIDAYNDPSGIITGTIDLRGQKIPTLDLKQRMGGGSATADNYEKRWVLIVYLENVVAGLVVDAVTRIFRISPSSILPAPDIILSGMNSPYVRGVFESDLGILVVLDVNRLLTGDDIAALKTWAKKKS